MYKSQFKEGSKKYKITKVFTKKGEVNYNLSSLLSKNPSFIKTTIPQHKTKNPHSNEVEVQAEDYVDTDIRKQFLASLEKAISKGLIIDKVLIKTPWDLNTVIEYSIKYDPKNPIIYFTSDKWL